MRRALSEDEERERLALGRALLEVARSPRRPAWIDRAFTEALESKYGNQDTKSEESAR